MVGVDQSVTIRKISKSLHESVENIGVVLSRGLGGVSGDDAASYLSRQCAKSRICKQMHIGRES
jgi:hypothetical protein